MITHANPVTNGVMRLDAASNFYAVTGKPATVESAVAKQSVKSLRANSYDSKHIAAYAATLGEVVSKPQLAYVYLPTFDETKLAYKTEIKYDSVSGFEHDILFFDAATGAELTRHPQVHRAKAHYTYDMRNRLFSDSFAPGILMCLTNDVCRDESSQRAHSGASVVYDYYYNVHGRESIINSLTPVISTVHTGVNWNNAAWYQKKIFYGDGDSFKFRDFTYSLDIMAHEYTHGVIEYSSGLVYNNESGALNEAFADIFGVAAEAYSRGSKHPDWLMGADSYTPGTSGDALRYVI